MKCEICNAAEATIDLFEVLMCDDCCEMSDPESYRQLRRDATPLVATLMERDLKAKRIPLRETILDPPISNRCGVAIKFGVSRIGRVFSDYIRFYQRTKTMAGILPTAAESDLLTDMVASELPSWFMRLISGNITPSSSTTLATLLANEASFTGYAPTALTSWTAPSIDGTSAAITTSTQGLFTGTGVSGTGNIYGYFLTNSGGTKLFGCERFASAPLSEPQNVTLEIDCTFSLITRF